MIQQAPSFLAKLLILQFFMGLFKILHYIQKTPLVALLRKQRSFYSITHITLFSNRSIFLHPCVQMQLNNFTILVSYLQQKSTSPYNLPILFVYARYNPGILLPAYLLSIYNQHNYLIGHINLRIFHQIRNNCLKVLLFHP